MSKVLDFDQVKNPAVAETLPSEYKPKFEDHRDSSDTMPSNFSERSNNDTEKSPIAKFMAKKTEP